ncbi:unnamed protein product [Kuraishia capsulata CBS 1993]|uniref:DNL-type domain-containing protein n=1 Tax=Kuraishia capsulata CBS 1993 TaxID=1382522 RepID=W6MTN5_9ASCO|nr:uncharacterized protein KUCA_T00001117001 [Kuraishia capsulata CBS 1993]CDK25150.1 unnamed protein product [Kuraishia capsulata CBS 1993]
MPSMPFLPFRVRFPARVSFAIGLRFLLHNKNSFQRTLIFTTYSTHIRHITMLPFRFVRPAMRSTVGIWTRSMARPAHSRMPLSTTLRTLSHSRILNQSAQLKVDKPELMIAFTCKKCDTRSSHVMSKQAYTSGTVLIQCPGCSNRHLIADHLKIFSDDSITIEQILAEKGESTSTNVNDLVFEDIPEKLKGLLGKHAKDAPESHKEKFVEGEEEIKKIGSKE